MSDCVISWTVKAASFLCPWDFPVKNTGVGCHYLLQGFFLNQGSKLCLLHWQVDLYHWVTREAPLKVSFKKIQSMVKLIIISLAFTLDRVNNISYIICHSTQHIYYIYAILPLSGLEAPEDQKKKKDTTQVKTLNMDITGLSIPTSDSWYSSQLKM